MPPKRKDGKASKGTKDSKDSKDSKSSKSSAESCCVCCQSVSVSKDGVLFCSGTCQRWMHRYCAGVSVIAFQCIKESGSPFLCFCCHQIRSQDVSAQLTNKVQQLEEEIRGLKTALNSAAHHSQQPSQLAGTVTQDSARRSYASVAGPSGESDSNPVLKQEPNPDKKFKVVSVVSGINSSVQSQAIKDCFRLGKFNPQRSQPRPILVKFVRIADVSRILSNKSVLSPPIRIKPDMSPEERLRDSILLKERWSLIQSGIPKNDIRIRKSHLYVKNKLHGQYKNSMFVHSISPTPSPAGISPDQSPIVPSGGSDSVCQPLSSPTSPVPTIVPSNSSVIDQSPSVSPISDHVLPCQTTGPQESD